MNRIESETRALRYLAIVQFQASLTAANGVYLSTYTETAIQRSLNAATDAGFENLNDTRLNFPAIDLLSSDKKSGIQATRKVTKAKYNKTIGALRTELGSSRNQLGNLQEVQIVGFECVRNPELQEWHTPTGLGSVRVRAIELHRLLRLKGLTTHRLHNVERVLQGLASTLGPNLRSDDRELETIRAFMDRPALHDRRHNETHWGDLSTAMQDLRRLLSSGANAAGVIVTRGWQTFEPPIQAHLKAIYDASRTVTHVLREAAGPGHLTPAREKLVDGYRLRMQEELTAACNAAGIAPPQWDPSV